MDKLQGEVRVINGERGFGFIAAEDRRDYFFHFNNVLKGTISPQRLVIGDKVIFNVLENEDLKRNPQAVDVEFVNPDSNKPNHTGVFATLGNILKPEIKDARNETGS